MFQVRFGLGGGFGGCGDWENVPDIDNYDDAVDYAYEQACEVYKDYDGMYGIRNVTDIMEEEELDEEEAYAVWCDERESWLDYEAREVDAE